MQKQELTAEELLPFSKLIHPNIITKAGRKLLASLESDQNYTLQDIINNCNLKRTQRHLGRKFEGIGTRGGLHSICQRRGEKILTEAPRIRVSTIHKAKGGEADNVALLLDSTKACTEQWDQDPEYRVFYVGMTRAKKHYI